MADEEKPITYEVWNFAGHGKPDFVSDDPIAIVHWLRAHPDGGYFNVHPVGRGFLTHKMIARDFISYHRDQVAEDLVRKAFERGESEGLAQEIINLTVGR